MEGVVRGRPPRAVSDNAFMRFPYFAIRRTIMSQPSLASLQTGNTG